MAIERIDIGSLLGVSTVPETDGKVFAVRATIGHLNSGKGWCFFACDRCSRFLGMLDGPFDCPICSKECPVPVIRYMIHAGVADGSGMATFVLFDREANRLIGHVAATLAGEFGVNSDPCPEAISKLVGKTLLFKIRAMPYNLEYKSKDYMVTDILDDYPPVVDKVVTPADKKEPSVLMVDGHEDGLGELSVALTVLPLSSVPGQVGGWAVAP